MRLKDGYHFYGNGEYLGVICSEKEARHVVHILKRYYNEIEVHVTFDGYLLQVVGGIKGRV